jgi:hypothetical protein
MPLSFVVIKIQLLESKKTIEKCHSIEIQLEAMLLLRLLRHIVEHMTISRTWLKRLMEFKIFVVCQKNFLFF